MAWMEELEQRKQAGQNALDEKEQQVQELKDNLLSVQEEKDTLLEALGDMIKSLMLSYAQEVSRLKRKNEEACNTSINLQQKLDLQTQVKQCQSEDESILQEEIEQMNADMTKLYKLYKELIQTKANMEEQRQEARKA
ncbi:hypothetical protein WMY93_017572 [Mugilogobius chulae]|uniref:Uncharacterized protein n=1 Tax=Mugilogobius chulae TaxID=88201 RepID=A0AAW0NNN2_9GOBI